MLMYVCVNLGETTWVYSIIRLDKTLNHMYRKENDLCIFPIQYKHNTKVMKDKEAEKLQWLTLKKIIINSAKAYKTG